MKKVVSIEYKPEGRQYDFYTEFNVKVNDITYIHTSGGIGMGRVVSVKEDTALEEHPNYPYLKKISSQVEIVNQEDVEKYQENELFSPAEISLGENGVFLNTRYETSFLQIVSKLLKRYIDEGVENLICVYSEDQEKEIYMTQEQDQNTILKIVNFEEGLKSFISVRDIDVSEIFNAKLQSFKDLIPFEGGASDIKDFVLKNQDQVIEMNDSEMSIKAVIEQFKSMMEREVDLKAITNLETSFLSCYLYELDDLEDFKADLEREMGSKNVRKFIDDKMTDSQIRYIAFTLSYAEVEIVNEIAVKKLIKLCPVTILLLNELETEYWEILDDHGVEYSPTYMYYRIID